MKEQLSNNPFKKLDIVFKEAVWGGNRLSKYFPQAPTKMSEAWLFVNTPEYISSVSNLSLSNEISSQELALVIKLLNAENQLSIQVHPQKNELLYICDADEGACIYCGFKTDCTTDDIEQISFGKNILPLMNCIQVKKGNLYLIPHGTVHSYGSGIIAIELQNNELETYRIYDFDRLENGKKRPLHLEKAIEVLSLAQFDVAKHSFYTIDGILELGDKFAEKIQIVSVNQEIAIVELEHEIRLAFCLDGSGCINEMPVKMFDAFYTHHFCKSFAVESKESMKLMLVLQ